jgi:hypothetical protein
MSKHLIFGVLFISFITAGCGKNNGSKQPTEEYYTKAALNCFQKLCSSDIRIADFKVSEVKFVAAKKGVTEYSSQGALLFGALDTDDAFVARVRYSIKPHKEYLADFETENEKAGEDGWIIDKEEYCCFDKRIGDYSIIRRIPAR